MKSQIENVSQVKKVIRFEIPWEDVEKHVNETVRTILRSARIPGFRPGKAPEALVRSRFANQIKDEVIQHIIPEAYGAAIKENEFDIVAEPSLHDVMYSEGSPLLFQVTVETRPQIELKDYKGIEIKSEPVEVKPEEVENVMKAYQARAAELIPLDAAAKKGDFVSGHVHADMDKNGKKQKVFDARTNIEIGGEGNHAAFNENLEGKKAGDKVEFDAFYPEDYAEKSLAGKTVHYTIAIESVNERKLPELDDEFAKDLGEYKTLDELREKVKADILEHKKAAERSSMKEEMLRKLIENNPFEVPESQVKREAEGLLNEYAYSMHRGGADLKDPSIKWDEIHQKLTHKAEENVRGVLILDQIAKTEKIEVNEDEEEKEIGRIADQQRRPMEAVMAEFLKEEGRMDRLRSHLRVNKTLDFLVDNANIKSA